MRIVAAAIGLAMIGWPLAHAAAEADRGFEDITKKAGVAVPHHNRQFDNEYSRIMAGYTALGASASPA